MGWSPSTDVVSTGELDLNASAVAEPGMEASDGVGIGYGVEAKEDGLLVEEKDSRVENDVGVKNTIGGSGSNGFVGKRVVDLERTLEDEDLAEDTGDRMVDEELKLEDGGMRIEEEADDKTELVAQTQSSEEIIGEEMKLHGDQDEDLGTKARDLMGDASMDAGDDGDGKVLVEEQQRLQTVRKRGRKRAPGTLSSQDGEFPRYKWSSEEEKAGLSVPDLVWGKVRSHPWWPGQIFDPSDASDMALKHNKKDNHLVAYFGDKTFAWCDESQLKPFLPHFSQMEKQSNLDAFVDAVDCVLEEVSRRTELGMVCNCIPEEAYYNLKYQTVDNAGIREGTYSAAADRFLNASSFQPDRLLEYIGALAHFPYRGADNVDLVIAKAQLKAFYQSKGYPELPQFLPGGTLVENDAEILPSQSEISEEDETKLTLSRMISGKRKLKVRRSLLSNRRHVKEEGRKKKSLSELMEVTLNDAIGSQSGGKAYGKSESVPFDKHWKGLTADSAGPGRNKKKRLDALGDLDTEASSPTSTKPLKVGERISRIASQMACSPSIFELDDGISKKAVGKSGKREGSTIVSDALPHSLVGTRKRKRNISNNNSSPSEMLSQLCLVARDPMKEHGFESAVISFFTGVRGMVSSSSMEVRNHVGQKEMKRGRKKSANSEPSPSDPSNSVYKMDSYWSDIIFEDSLEKSVQTNRQKRQADSQVQLHKEKKKKRKNMEMKKPAEEASSVIPLEPVLETRQKLQDGSICSFVEKPAEECSPTTLILSFTESDALPSETDLIRIFGQYGPLDEAETEVMKKNNRAKVVFKKRADAEMAFSSAGKFSIFGPALVSYRLRYSASKPKAPPNSAMKTSEGTSVCGVTNSIVLAREVSAESDNTQIPAQVATVLSDDAQVGVTAKGSSG
ncbi:putative non-specific serine/threonine protein kinase [Dioscorea sansibarensis]